MLTMGIDPSLTGTGVVVLSGNDIKEKRLISTTPRQPMLGRLGFIASEIVACYKRWNPDKVAMEGLSFGSKGQAVFDLGGLHWCIRMELGVEDNLLIVPPTTLKKWVCGKGNVNKNVMLMKIYRRWKVEFTNDNEADAYALARYAVEG